MNRGILCLATGLAAAWWGAGCTVFPAAPDPTRFYVLEAPAPPDAAARDGWLIGLERIGMPEYLRARTIAVRNGRTEVVYADFHRWADGFEVALQRAVVGHLRAAPSIRAVQAPPWTGEADFDRLLQINMHACEGWMDGSVSVAATWRIRGGDSSSEPVVGQADLVGRWNPGDYRALTETLSELVGQLSARIVADLDGGGAPET